jgi:hypothetical protein
MKQQNNSGEHPAAVVLWHLAPGTFDWRLVGTFASASDAWAACRRESDLSGVWRVLPAGVDANSPSAPRSSLVGQ